MREGQTSLSLRARYICDFLNCETDRISVLNPARVTRSDVSYKTNERIGTQVWGGDFDIFFENNQIPHPRSGQKKW